jgi:hypothetical protein
MERNHGCGRKGKPSRNGTTRWARNGPVCQAVSEPAVLVEELKQRFEAAVNHNRTWKERTGLKLHGAITRHVALHTQLPLRQSREVGTALESLTLHLKRITGSLGMTPTRPDQFELILLLEKPSWDAFRKVMEQLYTPQQLGEAWFSAQRLNSYDHVVTPHLYETKETMRTRPPSCGATFIVARRQLSLATDWQAPLWLSEGFAAYGDYVVHRMNRWYSVYAGEQVPVGDWMEQARRLATSSKSLPWSEIFQSELRDWREEHHVQSMAMAAFLLEAEPGKFLDFCKRLAARDDASLALEAAYRTTITELEKRWSEWIIARR